MTTTQPPAAGSPLRTILLVVGSLVLVAIIAYIVIAIVLNANRTDASREVEFTESFSELAVDSEVADVVVTFADVKETTVDFRQNDSTRSFEFDAELVGSALEVRLVDRWAGLWLPFGNVTAPSLIVTLPEELAGVDITVETRVGDVRLDGDFGTVWSSTGVGDLTLQGSATRTELESGVGDLTVRDYSVEGDLVIETGTGDIKVDLASVPESLSVNSGVGDQKVTLPAGRYRIDAQSGVGEISELADSDPDASTVLRFEAGVGDITVDN